MKATKIFTILVLALSLMLCSAKVGKAAQMGSAFTYQGRLIDANDAADGLYDFQFKLFDDPNIIIGQQIGSTIDVNDMDVIDGYFTAELDFGGEPNILNGQARWLDISVRPGDSNDPNDFVTLSPRQEVAPTPYALYAKTAGGDNDWMVTGNNMYAIPSGNVGIGTASPTDELTIGDGGKLRINSAGNDKYLRLYHDDTDSKITGSSGHIYVVPPVSKSLYVRPVQPGAGYGNPQTAIDAYVQHGGDGFGTIKAINAKAWTNSWTNFDKQLYGIYAETSDTRTGRDAATTTSYGIYGKAAGTTWGSSTAYGIYGTASGADRNWAGYFDDGNVYIKNKLGVGTTTPAAKLHIAGTPGIDGIKFPDGTSQTSAALGDGHSLDAADGSPVDVVYADNAGNVGIGTTSPSEKLEVAGVIRSTTGGFKFPDGTIQTTADTGPEALTLPYAGITSTSIKAFSITNNGSGDAVYGKAQDAMGRGVYGEASGSNGRGVYGFASKTGNVSNFGGFFTATGSQGLGVYGEATSTDNYTNYGGHFLAKGVTGRGVYGQATNISGVGVYGYASNSPSTGYYTNFGGYFKAGGTTAKGVYGEASNSFGTHVNYGGYFQAAGANGQGVYGKATNTGAYINYGGYFEAGGEYGRGVYGKASNTGNYNNIGGYFEAAGGLGTGVWGAASGTNGNGARGEASGSSATGVLGIASNTGDVTNTGVRGHSLGAYGWGVFGYTSGAYGRGVYGAAPIASDGTNYGGYFEAGGNTGRGVYGHAHKTGIGVTNYGGYFEAKGNNGRGVYGEAPNYGVYGKATGLLGIGVYGEASNTSAGNKCGGYLIAKGGSCYGLRSRAEGSGSKGVCSYGEQYDFYAEGPGMNYGPFTGAHEVKLSDDFPKNVESGMVVSVTGQAKVRYDEEGEVSISSTLPTVKLSQVANDKAVFGVLVSETPLPKDHWYQANGTERFATVNALGEGRVWICDINGKIEAGDYVTTSSVPGYSQKQGDDLLRSCTLGKAIETVDWDSVPETIEFDGQIFKTYLIAVVYTSG